MTKRAKVIAGILCIGLIVLAAAAVAYGKPQKAADSTSEELLTGDEQADASDSGTIAYWNEDSPAMLSILAYVEEVTEESSEHYVPPEDRIAVFDFDGTLYGELFPSYFDHCLLIHRALYDESYEAPEELRDYAAALEYAHLHREPEPDSDKSTAQLAAEAFAGMTVEEYREYVRAFMASPAVGFEEMTYGEGFYKPMTALVQYLAEHDFKVFISSGSERAMVRELIEGTLDEWIPSEHVIGSTFSLEATGQGGKAGRSYSYTAEDQVIMEGNLISKNQKTNKVFTIVDEIGKPPVLVFGNSSGDLAMAQYAIQHGGKAYMLLCDDEERDYGDVGTAEKFAASCTGMETVSMKKEFATIYGEEVVKSESGLLQEAEELAPAA
ncbi:MAG: haloacid dehalogenase-like hydrolase [Mogibacterium sp.]|nr:haloacid dehalogenase-like hydrolase [Mogibacterium sp.]